MSASTPEPTKGAIRRVALADIARMHADGERIAMLTAYDYATASIVDEAGVPLILVGDSLGEVVLGYDSTARVSMTEMLHHVKAVMRGTKRSLVVADMPFMSYGLSPEESVRNAGSFLSEGGAQAVKIEGGVRSARTIGAIARAGIAVMGHIGWTPQAKQALGGKVRVQGKTSDQARALLADAFAVQEAGAFAIVLELVPEQLATAITERLRIPTIGIGAGPGCSGQVLVINDLLGLGDFAPRHARRYAELRDVIGTAVREYVHDVESGAFPGPAETVRMDDAVLEEAIGRSPLDQPAAATAGAIPLDRDL
jgi:3-methyl-2-oxobutanoate hydroxymethyltransferase